MRGKKRDDQEELDLGVQLHNALLKHQGLVVAVAKDMGWSRNHTYTMMRRFNIKAKQYRPADSPWK